MKPEEILNLHIVEEIQNCLEDIKIPIKPELEDIFIKILEAKDKNTEYEKYIDLLLHILKEINDIFIELQIEINVKKETIRYLLNIVNTIINRIYDEYFSNNKGKQK